MVLKMTNTRFVKYAFFLYAACAVVVIGVLLIGFQAQMKSNDSDYQRVSSLAALQSAIQQYNNALGMLPASLGALKGSPYLLPTQSVTDPTTGIPFEYSIQSPSQYTLCATFETSVDGYLAHQSGKQCFNFVVTQPTIVVTPKPTSSPIVVTATTAPKPQRQFADPNIQSVSTDAKNITYSNYPWGLFTSDLNEWGLINYNNDAVHLTVTFKKPVKITKIANMFSNCTDNECYYWMATGVTSNGERMAITSNIVAENHVDWSEATTTNNKMILSVIFDVARLGGPDHYVHWKKIRFTYAN